MRCKDSNLEQILPWYDLSMQNEMSASVPKIYLDDAKNYVLIQSQCRNEIKYDNIKLITLVILLLAEVVYWEDGTHRSDEPVSKSTVKFWGGVPKVMGQYQ